MNAWLSFWFGNACRLCNAELLPQESALCTACKGLLPFAWLNDYLQIPCEGQSQSLNIQLRSWLIFSEQNAVRTLIHRIKYKSDRSLAVDLGKAMGQDLGSFPGISIPQVWLPVPIHPKRLRMRGYNQSEDLAIGLQSILGGRIQPKLLKRTNFSQSQTKNSKNARSSNVAHAFSCQPTLMPNTNTLIGLVDDVITTGSTLKACCSALHSAGFSNIQAWTLGCSGWL